MSLASITVLIGAIVFGALIIKDLKSKSIAKKFFWPKLAKGKKIKLEGMSEAVIIPQYGYYSYRNFYYLVRKVPCIIIGIEVVEGEILYKHQGIIKDEIGFARESAVVLLGREEPKATTKF